MKKIVIVFSIFIILSFLSTSMLVEYLNNNDPLMLQIKNNSSKYKKNYLNAEIIGNSIISGVYGKSVDYKKSYYKMKRYGTYNEALTCFKDIKPTISIEDNYDKYLIGGNKSKKDIALVFIGNDLNKTISILDREQIPGTFFIDGININNNSKLIKNSNHEFEILNYDNSYNESLFKISISYLETITKKDSKYCYSIYDNDELLKLCSKLKLHTIKPTIIVSKNLYSNVNKNLNNSIIIAININNYTLKELATTIKYIKNKGYNLVTLEELLEEKIEK